MSDEVTRSKFLSWILRHAPGELHLKTDEEAYVDVASLLENIEKYRPEMKMTFEQLEALVSNNSKKRFAFNFDKTFIRASQGHTIAVAIKYEKVTERFQSDTLYHGTTYENAQKIISSEGIHKGSRHHVHLSSNYNTALEVAKRRRKPYAILCVDAGAMQDDGIEFFISENKVVLVDFVHVKYLKYMDHAVEVAPFIKSLDTSKYRGNGDDVLRCKVTFTPMPKYKPQTDTED